MMEPKTVNTSAFFEEHLVGRVPLQEIHLPLAEAAPSSPPPEKARVCEAALQSFVMLQFAAITGARCVSVVTSRTMESEPDVLALDEFGRVHVFELKSKPIKPDDVEQAIHYMCRYVFADVDAVLEEWVSTGDGAGSLSAAENAVSELLAIWANEDPGKVGHPKAIELFQTDSEWTEDLRRMMGAQRSKTAWRKEIGEGRLEWRHELLRCLAAKSHGPTAIPSLVDFRQRAAAVVARTGYQCVPPAVRPRSQPYLVLWVGAPSIPPTTLEEIRRVRERGIDLRAFECDLRRTSDAHLWVRLARERAPMRDDLERRVRDDVACAQDLRIRWNLCAEKKPSDRGKGANAAAPGSSLAVPSATIARPGAPGGRTVSIYDAWSPTAAALKLTDTELDAFLAAAVDALRALPWRDMIGAPAVWDGRLAKAPAVVNASGRRGVELLGKKWTPGVFIGFVVDGTDHAVMPSDPAQGVDLSLIFDIKEPQKPASYAGRVLQSDVLNRIVSALTQALPASWSVVDVRAQAKPNLYHPIHLRRPLAPVVGEARGLAEIAASLEPLLRHAAPVFFKALETSGALAVPP